MQTITGWTQGVDFAMRFTPPESRGLTFRPGSDHVVLKLFELKELVRDDETELTFSGRAHVVTLTDRAGDFTVTPEYIDLFVAAKKSQRFPLPALTEKITRVLDAADPPNVTLTYPSQLLHGLLVVSDAAGKTIDALNLEFRIETSPNHG